MKKKMLACMLCLCVCVTAGCQNTPAAQSSQTEQDGGSAEAGRLDNFNLDGTLPIVKDPGKMEPITIAVVIGADSSVPTKDKEMTKKITEETGIPIEWQEIPADGSAEKINLMLTSGEYPDVFWNGISSDMAVQYSDQDIFVPTEDLIDQYAPKLAQIFKDHPSISRAPQHPTAIAMASLILKRCTGLY